MLKLTEAQADRLRAVFEEVASYASDPADLVFRALQHAHWIMKRLPGGNSLPKMKSPWPAFTLSDEERDEAFRQLEWMILKGLANEDYLRPPPPVSPAEIAQMDDIMTVLRDCCVGAHAARDWSIINLLAMGMTAKGVAERQQPKVSVRTVNDRLLVQCGAIGKTLSHLMDGITCQGRSSLRGAQKRFVQSVLSRR